MSIMIIAIVCVLVLACIACATENNSAGDGDATKNFKTVGYYSGGLFNEAVYKLQTEKLTHIMYAFLIPNDDGTVKPLAKPNQLAMVTTQAHNDGAKVYIALGDWSYEEKPLVGTFEKIGADGKLRATLVKNTVDFVLENDLDGVEIDWEHPNAKTIGDYEKLVIELAAALKAEGKSLTAAVNGAWSTTAGPEVSKLMTDKCLNSFEFISVMSYDMNNGEHSPLWFGNTSIEKAGGIMLFDVNEDVDWNDTTLGKYSVVSMIDETAKSLKGYSKAEVKDFVTVVVSDKVLKMSKFNGEGAAYTDKNNRVMLPMRNLLESIDAKVSWNTEEKTASVIKDNIKVSVKIGDKFIKVNGEDRPMDTVAIIRG